MNTRQALNVSKLVTPNVRAKTLAAQRQQVDTQMQIAANAWQGEDWDLLKVAASNLNSAVIAYHENLEIDRMNRCTVAEAHSPTLVEEAKKRALNGDEEAQKALIDAAQEITAKRRKEGKTRGAS